MTVALYDEAGCLQSVETVLGSAVAGEAKTLKTEVSLDFEIKKGYKIKLFMLKDFTSIQPLSNAEFFVVK